MVANNTFIDNTRIESYREEYVRTNCIFLPGFLPQAALNYLLKKISNIQFQTKFEMDDRNKFGKLLLVPQNDPLLIIFQLLMNNTGLFSVLEEITGCEPIGNFMGRIHRSEEGEQHGIEWHSDNSDNRLLAMSLGLGTSDYTGGKLQVREKGSDQTIREFGQLNAGDAIIFKIAPVLQHRLTVLETGQRTVGVGWFRSKPDLATFAAAHLKPY